ncbi:sensor histidine kinase [Actinokineospora guangxiensis]|uniref:histidine kinase n=1 Tax=Actinokineospora guangxiensis TaxID=1490288 RepID=A0ABW0EHL9_9PSEU
MNRDSAFVRLASGVPSERLEAARYLQFWAVPADIPELRSAISAEPIQWIRGALESALARLGDESSHKIATTTGPLTISGPKVIEAEPLTRANIARALVHELGTSIASIYYNIETEWIEFDQSRTKIDLDRLKRFLESIAALAQVSESASPENFELSLLAASVAESAQRQFGIQIAVDGPSPLELNSDRGLVEIILQNALKNACEAAIANTQSPIVSLVFNRSDRETWIAVRDNGGGLPPGGATNLFQIGLTTKDGHSGIGLPICIEAARSLSAQIFLESEAEGTRFELLISRKTGEA